MVAQADIANLKKLIERSRRMVFFGGAGVSTESASPDFRSQDGLYKQKYKYPPETILSHTFFMEHPEEFLRVLPREDALPRRASERRALQARAVGEGGEAFRRHHAEHRRAAPKGGQQKRSGAARQRVAQLLRAVRHGVSRAEDRPRRGRTALPVRGSRQAGCRFVRGTVGSRRSEPFGGGDPRGGSDDHRRNVAERIPRGVARRFFPRRQYRRHQPRRARKGYVRRVLHRRKDRRSAFHGIMYG